MEQLEHDGTLALHQPVLYILDHQIQQDILKSCCTFAPRAAVVYALQFGVPDAAANQLPSSAHALHGLEPFRTTADSHRQFNMFKFRFDSLCIMGDAPPPQPPPQQRRAASARTKLRQQQHLPNHVPAQHSCTVEPQPRIREICGSDRSDDHDGLYTCSGLYKLESFPLTN